MILTGSSSEEYCHSANSVPSMLVDQSKMTNNLLENMQAPLRKANVVSLSYEESTRKLDQLSREIAKLYLKIKRCSKDVNITESQYINNLETQEDREERNLITRMDPMIVLQYINVSIDVIINLKFEDIENRMVENKKDEE